MSTPNQQLTELICVALSAAGVANDKEIAALQARILSGKIKSEDWYLAVENSLPQDSKEVSDGD
ncbi:hypothetical protein [Noviherbaspirillum sp.]|uniref:hypothetical protein n=1 Tax=Noviherbaspirillum sp. TaxID=1926288 RepID=UPI002B47D94A|nr:hypothetical protein [Noviherbaspirillum sp.]HJV81333.1 hypothetical protein [Noviherbaspirillum sp.]